MKKNAILLLALSMILLSGCSTSVETLNKRHTVAVLSPHLVSRNTWSVDKASFAAASAIEVLPVGGSDNNQAMCTRARADFTSVFDSNAAQLMTSLLGTEKASNPAEYVLRIQIGKVATKMGMFAWNESWTEIQLTFNLVRRQGGMEIVLPPVTVTGRSAGNTGNLYTFHKNAHIRANEAINTAFTKAQTGLADVVARQAGSAQH
jgi:hypothetical protein